MAIELRTIVINMKTLTQDIEGPITVGEGDMRGSKIRIIFTQEAAAQFSNSTKVYLCWWHQERDIRGYNVFTEIKNEDDPKFPPTWEITFPKSMLFEGHALACIQLVDKVSISTSTNFIIHILQDPSDDEDWTASDDYSIFKEAALSLVNLESEIQEQSEEQKNAFENMQSDFEDMQDIFDQIQDSVEYIVNAAAVAENNAKEYTNSKLTWNQLH